MGREELLREAASIRALYPTAASDDEKEKLRARYVEIDSLLSRQAAQVPVSEPPNLKTSNADAPPRKPRAKRTIALLLLIGVPLILYLTYSWLLVTPPTLNKCKAVLEKNGFVIARDFSIDSRLQFAWNMKYVKKWQQGQFAVDLRGTIKEGDPERSNVSGLHFRYEDRSMKIGDTSAPASAAFMLGWLIEMFPDAKGELKSAFDEIKRSSGEYVEATKIEQDFKAEREFGQFGRWYCTVTRSHSSALTRMFFDSFDVQLIGWI